MEVGDRIKHYIDEKGISQSTLSRRIGMDRSKLCLSLNGDRKLALEEYTAICRVLGVGLEQFVGADIECIKPEMPENIMKILSEIKKELQAIRSSLEHERTFIPEDSNGTHTIVGPGTNNPN